MDGVSRTPPKKTSPARQKEFSSLHQFVAVALALLIIGGIYFAARGEAGTTVNTTFTGGTPGGEIDLESDLVGHWTFDGENMDWSSSTAEVQDRSGQGNHGNATSSMTASRSPGVGAIGQALWFDGSSDYVVVSNSFNTTETTISGWLNLNTTSGVHSIVNKYANQSSGWGVRVNNGNIQIYDDIAGVDALRYATALRSGRWIHFAIQILENNENKLYLDGVLVGSGQMSAGDLSSFSGNFFIGYRGVSVIPGYTNGLIDDVRIYDRALSAEEVARLYQLGATTRISETITTNPTLESGLVGHWTFDGENMDWSSSTAEVQDRSGQGNHGNATTSMSTATSPRPGVIGQGLNFNGTNDYVNLPSFTALNNTTALTVCGWSKLQTLGTTNNVDDSGIFSKSVTSSNELVLLWYNVNAGGTGDLVYSFYVGNENTASNRVFGLTKAKAGVWEHVCGVMSGANRYLYVNGVLDNSAGSASLTTYAGGTADAQIGAWSSTTNFFYNGQIDDVRTYNRALSSEEVKRLYELGATTRISETITSNPTHESGLVGYWTFDGEDIDWAQSSAEIRDRSGQANHGDATSTLNKSTAPTAGALGQALRFNGTSEYIDIGDSFYSDALTVCAWFNTTVTGVSKSIVAKHNSSGTTTGTLEWTLALGSDGTVAWRSYNGAEVVAAVGATLVDPNTWYHVCAVQNGNGQNAYLYLDGVEDGSGLQSGVTANTTSRIQVGGRTNSDDTRYWNGMIDDARIYNRALSAEEVKRLYELGR